MHRIADDTVSLLTKIVLLHGVAGAAAGRKAARDLTEAGMEDLMKLQITCVSKKAWGRWIMRRSSLIAALACASAFAEDPVQRTPEYQIKAAFLYNFAKFVEWPAEALDRREAMVICVFGRDPFQGALDRVVAGKTVNGRPIEIRRTSDFAAARSCHVLFIAAAGSGHAGQITTAVRNFGVLTVTEVDRSSEPDSMINFVMEENRVRFQISSKAATAAGLRISAKLLQLAVPASGRRQKR
jgi:YfiR/HmsC-like